MLRLLRSSSSSSWRIKRTPTDKYTFAGDAGRNGEKVEMEPLFDIMKMDMEVKCHFIHEVLMTLSSQKDKVIRLKSSKDSNPLNHISHYL